jgi:hypothetical protein
MVYMIRNRRGEQKIRYGSIAETVLFGSIQRQTELKTFRIRDGSVV